MAGLSVPALGRARRRACALVAAVLIAGGSARAADPAPAR